MQIKYYSIPAEIKKLGMTQTEFAGLLGIAPATLNHRIKKDSPTLHWCVYGISCYLGKDRSYDEF